MEKYQSEHLNYKGVTMKYLSEGGDLEFKKSMTVTGHKDP
jgi:hypothetical protein